jgi:hypothetical protein
LTHLAANDYEMIVNCLAKVEQDPIVGPMLAIYKEAAGSQSPLSAEISSQTKPAKSKP